MEILVGLGGNLGSPVEAFARALEELAEKGQVVAASRLWRTRPVGPSQPDFLNAAAIIEWPAGPRSLLDRCREIEGAAGRKRIREEQWGPRNLDLDLLIAPAVVIRGADLEIPHPQFHQRRFALEPAAEVAPRWIHPFVGLTIETLAERAREREPDAIVDVVDFA